MQRAKWLGQRNNQNWAEIRVSNWIAVSGEVLIDGYRCAQPITVCGVQDDLSNAIPVAIMQT
jgi:hypothetical protein